MLIFFGRRERERERETKSPQSYRVIKALGKTPSKALGKNRPKEEKIRKLKQSND